MSNNSSPMVSENSYNGSSSSDEEDFIMLQLILSWRRRPAIQRTHCLTSALTSDERMLEYLDGHNKRMFYRFRMTKLFNEACKYVRRNR